MSDKRKYIENVGNSIVAVILLMSISCKVFSIEISTDSKNDRYIVSMEKGIKNYFEKEFFSEPDIIGSFTSSDNIIHVVQEVPHGNACSGGDIYIIWISTKKTDEREYKKATRVLSYCGGHDPIVSFQDGYLKVYIKPYKNDRWGTEKTTYVPGETWMYKPEWN